MPPWALPGPCLVGGCHLQFPVLQLSGIGDSSELKAAGIEPKVNLPGVGKNLQEHVDVIVVSFLVVIIKLPDKFLNIAAQLELQSNSG